MNSSLASRCGRALLLAAMAAAPWMPALAAPDGEPQPLAAQPRPASGWLVERWPDGRLRGLVPNLREQAQAVTPSDSLYPDQWWLQPRTAQRAGVADFSTAWQRSTGNPVSGAAAVVAVLDSGITSHPELNARLLPGWDFVSNPLYANDGDGRDNDPQDPGDAITAEDLAANPQAFSGCPASARSTWHGTIIAGQLAAVTNNGTGVAAANWFARVVPVRVAGKCGAAVGDIIDGMRWAAGLPVAGAPANPNPARVIVIGYGGIDACDINSSDAAIAGTARLYEAALAEVRQAGALVVAAAGNLRGSVGRPASCRGAFGVTALNREGFKAAYANFGPSVALATPGGDGGGSGICDQQLGDGGLVSTSNLGERAVGAAGFAAASGTSFAAPAVAAVASLMWALDPNLSLAQVEDGLRRTARPFTQVPALGTCSLTGNRSRCSCSAETCGAGMLDADEALRFAAAPQSWVAPTRTAVTLNDERVQACASSLGLPPLPPEPAPPTPPTPSPPTPAPVTPPVVVDGGGSGGGAASWPWLLGLALAVGLLGAAAHRPVARASADV